MPTARSLWDLPGIRLLVALGLVTLLALVVRLAVLDFAGGGGRDSGIGGGTSLVERFVRRP